VRKFTLFSHNKFTPEFYHSNLGVSFENYLEILKDKDLFLLCRFRASNHRLPIEIGRWQNINRENRECNLCQGRELGDEFHYLFTTK
jgi:hypothetical protein